MQKCNNVNLKSEHIYKRLVKAYNIQYLNFPNELCKTHFDNLLKVGYRVLPEDENALSILEYFVNKIDNDLNLINTITSVTFHYLPYEYVPFYEEGKVAYWGKGKLTFNRVSSLLNFSDSDKCRWVDRNFNDVNLIRINN